MKTKESGMTKKQLLIVLYFIFSLALMSASDETPMSIILILVLNFCNAARVVKKIPLP
ncbi:MAG: hypothetical protein LBI60_05755 [Bacteroidales bacterium]|jgi:hypothetical protein|nr:hypothetical protein [Bacteroidales bacterium]